MDTIEIARRLAELGQTEEAQAAYSLVLQEAAERNPELELEAASYLFFSQGNYQVAYTAFVSLYNRGFYQTELMDLMTQAFYLPNAEDQLLLSSVSWATWVFRFSFSARAAFNFP